MPKRIIIVRHGQTAHNKAKILQGHLDTPLDETGKIQADKAALLLKDEVIDVVYSSDLKRAMETAHATMKHKINKPVFSTPLLRERYFGKFQGMTFKEIGVHLSKFGEQGNFSFEGKEQEYGVETEQEIRKRVIEFRKLLEHHKGKTVAVFSHGGFIRHLLTAFGVNKEQVKSMYIPNATPFVLIKKGDTYILQD